jgi:hypothetical protein
VNQRLAQSRPRAAWLHELSCAPSAAYGVAVDTSTALVNHLLKLLARGTASDIATCWGK